MRMKAMRILALAVLVALFAAVLHAEEKSSWRTATTPELKALIPARAPVEKERIETEFRTASGIIDGQHRFVAGVVLITAGYSAEGKYSHFLIVQAPLKIGEMTLAPGEYVFGWSHNEDSLTVKFYEASSGKFLGTVEATRNPSISRVESFRIWPPHDKSMMQIGRFSFNYQIQE
jgi:hypothetical protein